MNTGLKKNKGKIAFKTQDPAEAKIHAWWLKPKHKQKQYMQQRADYIPYNDYKHLQSIRDEIRQCKGIKTI